MLTDRYVELAKRHREATENGNSDAANVAYHALDTLFSEIVAAGERNTLVPLLDHENPSVRAKAALHTYVLDARRSEAVLERVAAEPGLVGFSAGMTLRQLKNGGLTPT